MFKAITNQIYYNYAVDENGKPYLSEFKYGDKETGDYFCTMSENNLIWHKPAGEFLCDVITNEFERLQFESVMIRYGIQQVVKPPAIVNWDEMGD
ncbi:MAG: hypothetical protein FWG90_02065 [Oscillospiraceae bacterium]|nr:hypothetical protein [Oscillospiraceae bacterium]